MEHARMLVLSIDAMTGDDLRAAQFCPPAGWLRVGHGGAFCIPIADLSLPRRHGHGLLADAHGGLQQRALFARNAQTAMVFLYGRAGPAHHLRRRARRACARAA